ncbi:SREBP regulating gene protein isoform X1 [Neodiprion virginianus]|uniref:SREBP regulating gene protein isoform X1 n=1 Tax=Neodiprion virginianus TaxID=2961670 RepID=UPI001EE6CDCD|nr:SREBP regulating gene protein isoform X1 [Neodiprion virginianus]
MPSWTTVVRLLRRRFVLGVIFAVSLTYCALSLLQHEKGALVESDPDDDQLYFSTDKPYLWEMQVLNDDIDPDEEATSALNGSHPARNTCRNSIQGKALIVDEHGFVCTRGEVLPSGCCSEEISAANVKTEETDTNIQTLVKRERHSCQTCNAEGCCAVFEYCVSCCLRPGKANEPEIKSAYDQSRRTKKAEENVFRHRLRTLDRFQVCLATCRTSSASVRHENTYKDPHSKHCYNLLAHSANSNQRYRRDLTHILHMNNNSSPPKVALASFSTASVLSDIHLPRHVVPSNS